MLPDTDELDPLREVLLGESTSDGLPAWSGSRSLLALDKRQVDSARLEQRIPELAERARQRTERILGSVVEAVRALEEGDGVRAAEALVRAGEVEEESRRLPHARRFYEKALEQGRKQRNRRAEGLALRRLGRVARASGDLDGALRLYRQGWEVARAQGDVDGEVVGCQGSGNVLGELGRWEEAKGWFERGLATLKDRAPSVLHWQLYNNLAVVEARLGRFADAENWLARAGALAEQLGDATAGVFVDNARGRLRMAQERFADAEEAFLEALRAATDPAHRVTVLVNLADALIGQRRTAEAERAARQAEEAAIAHRLAIRLPDVYRVLGALARERNDPDGIVFFEQALELCASFRLPPIEAAAIQHEYALLEEKTGQLPSALERLRSAVRVFRETGALPELRRAEADLERLAPTESDPSGSA